MMSGVFSWFKSEQEKRLWWAAQRWTVLRLNKGDGYKVGDMGVKQAEPRLERKKRRRQSRKTVNRSIIEELDDLDDDDNLLDDSILRALRHESQ